MNSRFLFALIGVFSLCIGFILMFIAMICSTIYGEPHSVPTKCYDKFGSEIIGVSCLSNTFIYPEWTNILFCIGITIIVLGSVIHGIAVGLMVK